MLVHPLQPERHPTASRLEEHDFERGEAVEHTAVDERDRRAHLLERMRADVLHLEIGEAIGAGLQMAGLAAFVQAEWHTETLERRVERVVARIVERVTVDRVGTHEHAHHPELAHRPFRFDRCALRILARHHRDAFQPRRIGRAEPGEPVVVRAADRRCERGVEVVGRECEQSERRIQHGDVDALAIHAVELASGIEAPRVRVGIDLLEGREDSLPSERPGRVIEVALTSVPGVDRDPVDVHAERQILGLGLASPELGFDVLAPHRHRLDHVHVGVEDAEPALHVPPWL